MMLFPITTTFYPQEDIDEMPDGEGFIKMLAEVATVHYAFDLRGYIVITVDNYTEEPKGDSARNP